MKIRILRKTKMDAQFKIQMPKGVKDFTLKHNFGIRPVVLKFDSDPLDFWNVINKTENEMEFIRAHNDCDSVVVVHLLKPLPAPKLGPQKDIFDEFMSECGSCNRYKECIKEVFSSSCPSTLAI